MRVLRCFRCGEQNAIVILQTLTVVFASQTEEYFHEFDNVMCECLAFQNYHLKYRFCRFELIEQF